MVYWIFKPCRRVYIGFDNPKTLGKLKQVQKKTAFLPVFKDFIQNALFKDDFDDFMIQKIFI